MLVDGRGPYEGESSGVFQSLDLVEPLYIGAVNSFERIKRTEQTRGLVGCISRLNIGGMEHDLMRDATYKRGITTCETCAGSPCLNRGVCREAATKEGYSCICPKGITGDTCEKVIVEVLFFCGSTRG